MIGIEISELRDRIGEMVLDGKARVVLRIRTTPDKNIAVDGLRDLRRGLDEEESKFTEGSNEHTEMSFRRQALDYIENRWGGAKTQDLDVDEILMSISKSLSMVFGCAALVVSRADDEHGPGFSFITGLTPDDLQQEAQKSRSESVMETVLKQRGMNTPEDQLN